MPALPSTTAIHLFSGPTLGHEDALIRCPGLCLHPPVAHGDLFSDHFVEHDRILIVDGIYHQNRAVRHKELLHAMSRGLELIGAASIGALRASELHPFGFVGVGRVFEAYRDGVLDSDEEVAVAQRSVDDPRPVSVPLVNVREMILLGRGDGFLPGSLGDRCLELAQSIYYPQRNMRTLCAAFVEAGARGFADWLLAQLSEDEYFADVKRADAIEAIMVAQAGDPDRSSVHESLGDGYWRTGFLQDWVNLFADAGRPNLLERVQFQQIFDSHFPQVWKSYLIQLSAFPADGSLGLDLPSRIRERDGVDDVGDVTELFRPRLHLNRPDLVGVLLERETVAGRQRLQELLSANADYFAHNADRSHELFREDVVNGLLAELWLVRPADTVAESGRRGFRTLPDAVEAMRPFVIGHCQRRSVMVGRQS